MLRMRIRASDGKKIEVGPGDALVATPGHDAWVVGSEPCVMLDWTGIAKYAKKRHRWRSPPGMSGQPLWLGSDTPALYLARHHSGACASVHANSGGARRDRASQGGFPRGDPPVE